MLLAVLALVAAACSSSSDEVSGEGFTFGMILALVFVYSDWFKKLGDRLPRLRNLLGSGAPAALGTVFERE